MQRRTLALSLILVGPMIGLAEAQKDVGAPWGIDAIPNFNGLTCDGDIEIRKELAGFGPEVFPWESGASGVQPLFVPKISLGPNETLIAAFIVGCAQMEGYWGVENLDPELPCPLGVGYFAECELMFPDDTELMDFEPKYINGKFLFKYDGVTDFAGPSGHTFETPLLGMWDCGGKLIGPGPYLDLFVANAPGELLEIKHTGMGNAQTIGCGNSAQQLEFTGLIGLAIDYIVCVAPPPCNEGEKLVINGHVNFSTLDNGSYDLNGAPGVLELVDGLVLGPWSRLWIDVPSATFVLNGDLILKGDATLENDFFLPNYGPDITIETCGSVRMYDRTRIRSHGNVNGGKILICAQEHVRMEGISGIESNGFDAPAGLEGGCVEIICGGRFDMSSELAYITVEGVSAGSVMISACDDGPKAINVRGRILADGEEPGGYGGTIVLDAREGGMWIPGVNHLLATGEDGDGTIKLYVRTVLGPPGAPIVEPDPEIIFNGPNHGPCECDGGGS